MFYIEKEAWKKVMQYANAAYDEWKSEISGMLIAEQDEDGDWDIHSPVILKQTVSGGNTSLDKEELAKYYAKMGKKYNKAKIKFVWWHSHHTMKAFWSGTDDKAIEEYSNGDWSLALVVNLKEEYKFRVSVWHPIEMHEDVELEILGENNKPTNAIIKEAKAKCESPTVTHSSYGFNNQVFLNSPGHKTSITNGHNVNGLNSQYDLWGEDTEWLDALEFVDKLNDKYVKTEIVYDEWKALVVGYNTKELQYQSFYIECVTEQKLNGMVLYAQPTAYLKQTNGYGMPVDNFCNGGIV